MGSDYGDVTLESFIHSNPCKVFQALCKYCKCAPLDENNAAQSWEHFQRLVSTQLIITKAPIQAVNAHSDSRQEAWLSPAMMHLR